MKHKEMAEILKSEFGKYGYQVPTKETNKYYLKLIGLFDSRVSGIAQGFDKEAIIDSKRAREDLGVKLD